MSDLDNEEIFYNGKKILKRLFRGFVYGFNGGRILAHNYEYYQSLLATGVWFAEKEDVPEMKIISGYIDEIQGDLKDKEVQRISNADDFKKEFEGIKRRKRSK